MSDPWSRPAGNPPVVEIELTGPAPDAPTARDDAERDGTMRVAPSGRSRVALIVAGAVIAAVIIVALTGGDDDVSTAPPTSFDPSRVTTPPTLGTLPAATLPGSVDDAPGRTGSAAVPLTTVPAFDPSTVTVPTFDTLPSTPGDDGIADGEYDLLTAVVANTPGGNASRSTARLEGVQLNGRSNFSVRAVAAFDPTSGRDSITIDPSIGVTAEIITDRSERLGYRTVTGMDGRWEVFDEADFVVGTAADTLGELFDSLVEGPITARALAGATSISPDGGLVRLAGGAVARRWHVVAPIEVLRPYGQLLLANISQRAVDNGRAPDSIEFDVYVTRESRLALVASTFVANEVVVSFQQVFDRRPANVRIELPDPDTVVPRS